MFNSIKNYGLIIILLLLLSAIGLQHYQYLKLQNKLEICKNDALAVEIGSQYRQKQVKTAEQEAIESQAESLQYAKTRMHADAGKTCEDTIQWMIANKPV